jgi:hypothetical protein
MSGPMEFVLYARAERDLCEQAGPVLSEVVRTLAQRDNIQIKEIRVTFDWDTPNGKVIAANCTIVTENENGSRPPNVKSATAQPERPNQPAASATHPHGK